MTFNKCILGGHLTRDPEMRYAPKGTAIAQFGLAMNRKWKDEAGNEKEEVTFADCEAWGRTAETLAQYLRKGDPLLLEGRLKLDQWEDKTTHQPRQKLKVVVESFSFVGGKKDGAPPAAHRQAPAPAQQQPGSAPPPEEDAIPF